MAKIDGLATMQEKVGAYLKNAKSPEYRQVFLDGYRGGSYDTLAEFIHRVERDLEINEGLNAAATGRGTMDKIARSMRAELRNLRIKND